MTSTSRFEPLSSTSTVLAGPLQPLNNENARKCFVKLTTIQPRLRAKRFAAERAMEALTAAKAELRRINAISDSLIDTAVRIGDLFGFEDISDFANQDQAWLFTIEGLVTAFRARGELGKQVADRFTEVLSESRAIAAELNRAQAEYTRATTAFSLEYRALSSAIAFDLPPENWTGRSVSPQNAGEPAGGRDAQEESVQRRADHPSHQRA